MLHKASSIRRAALKQVMATTHLRAFVMSALLATSVLCTLLLVMLDSQSHPPSSSPATTRVYLNSGGAAAAAAAAGISAGILNSAYASFHTRMKMLRSLQSAHEEPVRFLLVTGEQPTACSTREGSHLLMMSLKNKVDYCNMHQCKVWYSLESWEAGFTGTWARYPLLKRLMLANPSIEWFMWMDSDAMFTDMSFEIPLQTYNEWNKHMVIPGYWEKVYNEDPDWVGLNAGIFLMRNTKWSQRFLGKWMQFGRADLVAQHTTLLNKELRTRPKDWPADDQSALIYLLRQNRTEHETMTYLEAGYTLHGFWELIVDSYESLIARGNGVGDKRWPFITHFCGCKLCTGEYATSQSKRCVENFKRAYNFADNQVLGIAGMRHLDLSTFQVETSTAI